MLLLLSRQERTDLRELQNASSEREESLRVNESFHHIVDAVTISQLTTPSLFCLEDGQGCGIWHSSGCDPLNIHAITKHHQNREHGPSRRRQLFSAA